MNISFLPEPKLLGAFKRAAFIQQQQLETLNEIRAPWCEPLGSCLEKLLGKTRTQRGKEHTGGKYEEGGRRHGGSRGDAGP